LFRSEAEWNQILATGQTIRREVDYGDVHYEYLASPLRADGVVAGITVISRDISALVRARERYQSFVANSSEAIWRFELDQPIDALLPEDEQIDLSFARGYLGECNDAMARMYGFEAADQIVGARLPDMLDPAQENNRQFLRAFIRGGYRLTDAESI